MPTEQKTPTPLWGTRETLCVACAVIFVPLISMILIYNKKLCIDFDNIFIVVVYNLEKFKEYNN